MSQPARGRRAGEDTPQGHHRGLRQGPELVKLSRRTGSATLTSLPTIYELDLRQRRTEAGNLNGGGREDEPRNSQRADSLGLPGLGGGAGAGAAAPPVSLRQDTHALPQQALPREHGPALRQVLCTTGSGLTLLDAGR